MLAGDYQDDSKQYKSIALLWNSSSNRIQIITFATILKIITLNELNFDFMICLNADVEINLKQS